jgi:hypothetical protein
MMQTEKAAAWFWLPASSSNRTETAASCVVGVVKKITAKNVTILRMKKNTPTLRIDGQIIRRVIFLIVRRNPAPNDFERCDYLGRAAGGIKTR